MVGVAKRGVAAFLVVLAALLWRQADPGGWLELGRATLFDVYQRIHPRARAQDRPVAVVDVDEASLATLGLLPWPRAVVTEMVANLFEAGAVAVAFDGVVSDGDDNRLSDIFARTGAGRGLFDLSPEAGGVVRRVPAALTIGDSTYTALALEMLRLAAMPHMVTTDAQGRLFLYAARYDRADYLSAADIQDATFDPARVAGKLVLVGSSAVAGVARHHATAVDRQVPAVEIHAQIVETVLANRQLSIPPGAALVEAVATLVGALLAIALVPRIGARRTVLVLLGAAVVLCGWSWWQFTEYRSLYDPLLPSVTALLLVVPLAWRG